MKVSITATNETGDTVTVVYDLELAYYSINSDVWTEFVGWITDKVQFSMALGEYPILDIVDAKEDK